MNSHTDPWRVEKQRGKQKVWQKLLMIMQSVRIILRKNLKETESKCRLSKEY
jgi:hypothetical protein